MKSLILLSLLCCISLCLSMKIYRNEHRVVDTDELNEIPHGDICSQAREVGPCRALFFRYGFDGAQNKCVEYMYGGCHGTANNFKSLEECTKACPGV